MTLKPKIANLKTTLLTLALIASSVSAITSWPGSYEIQNKNGKCVDLAHDSRENAVNVQLNTCDNSDSQKWIATIHGGVNTVFSNGYSGLKLDVAWGGAETNIQQWDDPNAATVPSSKWYMTPLFDDLDFETLEPNSNPGYCLDVDGNNSTNGTNIQIHICNDTDAQKFKFTEVAYPNHFPSGTPKTIQNKFTGKVLDIADGLAVAHTNVQQHSYNGTNGQKWTFIGSMWKVHHYAIISELGDFDISTEFSTNPNTNAVIEPSQYPYPASENLFQFIKNSDDGSVTIKSHQNKCLEVEWAHHHNGANIQFGACNGGNAQRWWIW
ncbi:MAG: RICIN domain-containing protein [Fibrobacterales bacterium]